MSNPLAVVRALLAHDSNGATSLGRSPPLLNCMHKEVEIVNKLGLHARPASEFVRCWIRFKSKITICKGDENFSAASILEALSADLDCGARVVLEAIGPMSKKYLMSLKRWCCVFAMKKVGLRETAPSTGVRNSCEASLVNRLSSVKEFFKRWSVSLKIVTNSPSSSYGFSFGRRPASDSEVIRRACSAIAPTGTSERPAIR